MRFSSKLIVLFMILVASVTTGFSHSHHSAIERLDIDIQGDDLIITNRYCEDDYVRITDHARLYINGHKVHLTPIQTRLLKKYYEQVVDIHCLGAAMGAEGVRIGIAGAALGIQIAVKTMRSIFNHHPHCTRVHTDLHWAERDLRRMGHRLKIKGELMEEMIDDFEYKHQRLKRNVPELHRLDWF
jgi:hypothetical protein